MALQAGCRRLLPQLLAPAGTSPAWAASSSKLAEAAGAFTSNGASNGAHDDQHCQGFHVGHVGRESSEREQAQPAQAAFMGSIPSLIKQHPSLLMMGQHTHNTRWSPAMSSSMLTARRGLSQLAPRVQQPLGLGMGLPRSPVSQLLLSNASPKRTYVTEGQMLGHAYMMATHIMFWTGLIGAVMYRRNLIVMLLATEVVMLACNLNFLFGSAYLNDMTGVIMSLTITTIAACETAIGLALCVTYFHMRSSTDVEALNFLK